MKTIRPLSRNIALTIICLLLIPGANAQGSAEIPAGTQSATTSLKPGFLVPLHAGNHTWDLPAGEYLLALAADADGLNYTLYGPKSQTVPAPCTTAPTSGTSSSPPVPPPCQNGEGHMTGSSVTTVKLEAGDVLALNVTSGSGRALVSKTDLYNASLVVQTIEGTGIFLEEHANATCTSYGATDSVFHLSPLTPNEPSGAPYDLAVAAPRADIVVYDSGLRVIAHAHDLLNFIVDPARATFPTITICYGHNVNPGDFAIHVTHRDASAQSTTTRSVPGVGILPIVSLLSLVAIRNRKR